jgi:parvulin-like peptidyl-prolyl isomerase
MKLSGKAIAAILVVAALALGGLLAQRSSTTSSAQTYNLSKQDMELLVNEVLPPMQAVSLNSNPENRQEFVKQLKNILTVAQEAEMKGLAEKPEVQEQIKLQTDLALRDAYTKKHPEEKISDEDVANYYTANPKAFDTFLDANPQFKAQAQGAQAEGLKKEFGMLKVAANKARLEKLDQDASSRIKNLLGRSQVLFRAYVNDLQQNSEKLVTDEDIQKYYSEHPNEFEEVRARHILISTSPSPAPPGAEKEAKKPLSKEEAKKKAQGLLDRVRKGENFEKLAQENSDDGSKAQGGDLGYFAKDGSMVAEFETAAFALKPGEVSEVVESQFGYHIIKVEDHRNKPLDEETKKAITEKIKENKIKEHIDGLVAQNKVQIAEDFQVTVTPPATPPGLSLPVQPSEHSPDDGHGHEDSEKQAAPAKGKNAKPATKEKKK